MSRIVVFLSLLIAVLFHVTPSAIADVAQDARNVLKNRCYTCHGEGGANEGGFNDALNRKRLVRELIVPENADESKLFQRVSKGEMPPDYDGPQKLDQEIR